MFLCHLCGLFFNTPTSFCHHMESHDELKCMFCGKCFSRKFSLERHEKVCKANSERSNANSFRKRGREEPSDEKSPPSKQQKTNEDEFIDLPAEIEGNNQPDETED